jgi:hypothetical protein
MFHSAGLDGPYGLSLTAVCSRPEAQSFVKSEIVKTESGDREEEGLVKERAEGRA